MSVNEILKNIDKEIKELQELKQQVENNKVLVDHGIEDYDENLHNEFNRETQWKNFTITTNIEKLQKEAIEANFLFFDAPFIIYENTYSKKLESFIEENPDAIESDFIREELVDIFNPKLNRTLEYNGITLFYHRFINDESKLKFAAARKIEFLANRLQELGKDYELIVPEPEARGGSELAQVYLIDSKHTVNTNKEATTENEKLKWTGGTAQLGLIIGHLAENGFIEAPKKPNGEINFARFSKLVLKNFESNAKADSLSKYLNIHSDKAQETQGKLDAENFYIPHVKLIS